MPMKTRLSIPSLSNKLLQQRCKETSLKHATKLDLSSLNLKELTVDQLSSMSSLTHLDVSKNHLFQFAPSSKALKHLKVLNCSCNKFTAAGIASISTTFPNLVELNLLNNQNFQKTEIYEIVERLPKLAKINDMDVTIIRQEIKQLHEELLSRIHAEYIQAFDVTSSEVSHKRTIEEQKDLFAENLKRNVIIGPEDLKKYIHRKLKKLAHVCVDEKNYLNSLLKGEKSSTGKEYVTRETFIERNKDYIENKLSYVKQNIDWKSSTFTPKHLLRLHSHNNDAEDDLTEVWYAAFEPNTEDSVASICAICGGEIIALINCNTGKLMKRYKQQKEKFYCLAWSSIALSSKNDSSTPAANILAAAGDNGEIRLIYPSQKICYAHVSPSHIRQKTPICCLMFHPHFRRLLFSGSEDGHIRVWEIDVPKGEQPNVNIRYMYGMKAESRPRILQISNCGNWLLAAYDKFCQMWNICDISSKKKSSTVFKIRYKFPFNETKAAPYFDGLALFTNNIAVCKQKGDDFISVWDPFHGLNTNAKDHKPEALTKEVTADILAYLQYPKSKDWFMQISVHDESGLIITGDSHSQIHLYDLKSTLTQAANLTFHIPVIKPSKIMKFPLKDVKVNHVIIDPSCKYIVAVTSSNSVCIWETSLS